jgi:hypothetical protein
MKTISQAAMNLVYPQTNSNWKNEIGLSFVADEDELDANGWLDPWSRPLDKKLLSNYKTQFDRLGNSNGSNYRETEVKIGHEDRPHTISLVIYKRSHP